MTSSLCQQVPVLTAEEATKALASIRSLQPLWDEDRYRLGAGISYYKPRALYYATSKQMNPIMRKHFDWLYDRLLQALSKHYDMPVTFRDDLAVPGFNIYIGQKEFSTLQYNTHVDLQFLELNWEPRGSANFESTMSFTLPIAVPENGTGLNIWNVQHGEISQDQLEESNQLDASRAEYQQYEVGIATIHNGKHYHQMSISSDAKPSDARITMQGHGLVQSGSLVIYG
ncbi:MAG TPA: hypothetical protein V6C76_14510 [Drouetiella sp.]